MDKSEMQAAPGIAAKSAVAHQESKRHLALRKAGALDRRARHRSRSPDRGWSADTRWAPRRGWPAACAIISVLPILIREPTPREARATGSVKNRRLLPAVASEQCAAQARSGSAAANHRCLYFVRNSQM